MSDFEVFEVPGFLLQKGGVLPTARLAYATRGKLNAARDNAVLVPSWYTGTHNDSETFMLGEDRALDPRQVFHHPDQPAGQRPVLLAQQQRRRPSSAAASRRSRSTTTSACSRSCLTEKLGVERLRLVTGWSMGACQTFQWAAQFPDMVRAACPIAGSARTGIYNKVFLLALRRALELDPVFADGFYDRPPVNGLQAFAAIYAGWGTSEPFFREEVFRPLGSRSTAEHVADFWEPFFLRCDANNLLSQLWTWEAGDISANPTYGGDFEAALGAIKARTIIAPVDNDRYFPPVDSHNEARHIPGAKVQRRRLGLGPHGADEPGRRAGDRCPAAGAAGRLRRAGGVGQARASEEHRPMSQKPVARPRPHALEAIFGKRRAVAIGVIHSRPLPGSPGYEGEPVEDLYGFAVAEGRRYRDAGLDGLIVENHGDIPFAKPDDLGPETAACMAVMAERVRREVGLPGRHQRPRQRRRAGARRRQGERGRLRARQPVGQRLRGERGPDRGAGGQGRALPRLAAREGRADLRRRARQARRPRHRRRPVASPS